MTPQTLASAIIRGVVEENTSTYKDLFSNAPISEAHDPYWIRAVGLFASLTDEQRSVFFEVIRQVIIDTSSNILGILDGSSCLAGLEGELALVSQGGERIDGDLQQLFLAEIEKQRRHQP